MKGVWIQIAALVAEHAKFQDVTLESDFFFMTIRRLFLYRILLYRDFTVNNCHSTVFIEISCLFIFAGCVLGKQ